MSNKRITDLTELTTPTTDDVFPVVDIASNTTTKVQLGNLPVPTAVTTALATKQDTLVSGTNIKTVNSTSLLGSGNVAVQETLVSGTNIKTLNSTSLLGSGNIVLTANPSGVSGAIQFSNGSAFASDAANLFWDDTNNRLGVGTNAPTATGHLKGSGSTSATTSLLVQNSAGTAALQVFDNGQIYMQQAGGASLFLDRIKAFTAADISMPLFLVGVGTLSASAAVQINATDRGFLPPRMTTTQKNAIATPAAGLQVYDTTTNKLCCYNGSTWNDLF
jgi:hypothetical protein